MHVLLAESHKQVWFVNIAICQYGYYNNLIG